MFAKFQRADLKPVKELDSPKYNYQSDEFGSEELKAHTYQKDCEEPKKLQDLAALNFIQAIPA